MKKLFFSFLLSGAICASLTSCGAGDQGPVDTDTVFTAEFADSFTTAAGNEIGAELARYVATTERMSGGEFDRQEFLKGIQLVTGARHSSEFIEGVQQGCRLAMTLDILKAQGLDVDRDELLRNIRRLVMADSISQNDYEFYATESERINQRINSILEKRELMRAGVKPVHAAAATADEPQFSPEFEEIIEDNVGEVVELPAEDTEE